MKKIILMFVFLCTVFLAYAENENEENSNSGAPINYQISLQASSSFVIKPFIELDFNGYYLFDSNYTLGLGIIISGNAMHGIDEPYVSGIFYTFFGYENFSLGIGSSFSKYGFESLYLKTGWSIPIWQAGKGKLGLCIGSEFYGMNCFTKCLIYDASEDSSEGYSLNNPFPSAVYLLNCFKLYFGITYFF